MSYDYQQDLQQMQELEEREKKEMKEKELQEVAQNKQKGKKNPNKKKRYTAADLKKMAVIVEKEIREGNTNVTSHAQILGVSHWTATKVNNLLKGRARRNAPDFNRLLINPSDAIKKLIPLLDSSNPETVEQAKSWLKKVAEYLD